ncbi:maleylpyruvate isomerase family mycothiol-dependent enzyme [Aestuariimicrobium sp. Y1814]|uniref:maleylpyruvate isomerase family mycothiol-dependent enzyme n=1 Tax=Aestuariimicrobium sp. Y1814 TaxID=3418742 RepID=UPI003DA74223
MDAATPGDDSTLPTVAAVRHRKMEATQHLLGDTIRLSDEEWQSPSLLPGWTRAHVATHLARNADGLTRSARGFIEGSPVPMYASESERQSEIERGSERSGLELQIDLDTSAGELNRVLTDLMALPDERLAEPVQLRPRFSVPARLLPMARLSEVVLHRIDLGVGYTIDDLEDDIAGWLLDWVLLRLSNRVDIPRLRLVSSSGRVATTGTFGDEVEVSGDDRHLLGWLTGRSGAESLTQADLAVLPLIG